MEVGQVPYGIMHVLNVYFEIQVADQESGQRGHIWG